MWFGVGRLFIIRNAKHDLLILKQILRFMKACTGQFYWSFNDNDHLNIHQRATNNPSPQNILILTTQFKEYELKSILI